MDRYSYLICQHSTRLNNNRMDRNKLARRYITQPKARLGVEQVDGHEFLEEAEENVNVWSGTTIFLPLLSNSQLNMFTQFGGNGTSVVATWFTCLFSILKLRIIIFFIVGEGYELEVMPAVWVAFRTKIVCDRDVGSTCGGGGEGDTWVAFRTEIAYDGLNYGVNNTINFSMTVKGSEPWKHILDVAQTKTIYGPD
ncbi:hypothetical protein PHJA_001510000 [Phtheirospermum japonicum]|uniref:Uncharacterized protein n=1 Tax=Phtheirospermum japonicum TaxID=374723 RepID=A0A830C3L3_9LAMI|nr:hypothetical protein PHJA_001510000 [Phtheirospermum japonicum]